MQLIREQIDQLVSDLTGTSKSLRDGLEGIESEFSEDDLDPDDTAAIDEQIFQCETCGYWFEVEEMAIDHPDGQICTECAEDGVNG